MALYQPLQRRGLTPKEDGTLPADVAYEYRRVIGAWLRDRRLAVGMTQREVGEALGDLGNTAVSAIEVGRSSLAPEHYEILAKIYKVDPQEFARFMLRWTNPWLYLMLLTPNDRGLRKELAGLSRRAGTINQKH